MRWDSWSGQPMNDTEKAYELYGDKILIGVIPKTLDASATERSSARRQENTRINSAARQALDFKRRL
jgi:hypothetical protein